MFSHPALLCRNTPPRLNVLASERASNFLSPHHIILSISHLLCTVVPYDIDNFVMDLIAGHLLKRKPAWYLTYQLCKTIPNNPLHPFFAVLLDLELPNVLLNCFLFSSVNMIGLESVLGISFAGSRSW